MLLGLVGQEIVKSHFAAGPRGSFYIKTIEKIVIKLKCCKGGSKCTLVLLATARTLHFCALRLRSDLGKSLRSLFQSSKHRGLYKLWQQVHYKKMCGSN